MSSGDRKQNKEEKEKEVAAAEAAAAAVAEEDSLDFTNIDNTIAKLASSSQDFIDCSDLETKVNLLLTFAVEQCSLGDGLRIKVNWKSRYSKKSIQLYWTLREEPNKDFQTCLDERWPVLEKYLQPQFRITWLRADDSTREIQGQID